MAEYEFGVIGLGTMGSNFLLNMLDKGFSATGYDKDATQVQVMNTGLQGRSVAYSDLTAFLNVLKTPRKIVLLVPAGKVVDYVLNDLEPLLGVEDIVVDSGNSFFRDTMARAERMQKKSVHFMGMGISGGEEGARHGASLMPGGDAQAYVGIGPMLEKVSARAFDEPCTAYMGNGAAGHYVKMVHNGIEYSMMQLISETWHLMKGSMGMSGEEIVKTFGEWNKGRLNSYLMEVTIAVLKQQHEGKLLVDRILDAAAQKGTGSWTSQDAFQIGCPVPAIDAAVIQRIISSFKNERVQINSMITDSPDAINQPDLSLPDLEAALYAGYLLSYSQGFHMIAVASEAYGFNTELHEVAKIWRGGCIIRSAMLQKMIPILKHTGFMLKDQGFLNMVAEPWHQMKAVLKNGVDNEVPLPGYSACFNYFLSFKSKWLAANLIQAQRDYFGAHGFKRVDMEGDFYMDWDF